MNQSMQLTRYDDACQAIAELRSLSDVRDIRDRAVAMEVYARRAKNRELEANGAEIRLRSTRRIGELIREQAETIGLNRGAAAPTRVDDKPTLDSQGIDKNLANAARVLVRLPADEFEDLISKARKASREASGRVVGSADKRSKLEDAVAPDVLAKIKGTPLDGEIGLEYLGGLDHDVQRERVGVLLSEEVAKWKPDEAAVDRLAALTAAWNVAEEPERRAFLTGTLGILGEWVTLAECEILIDKARKKLGWSMEELDHNAGLAERHTNKLLMRNATPGKKRLGPKSMMRVARAMGASHFFRVPALGDSALGTQDVDG